MEGRYADHLGSVGENTPIEYWRTLKLRKYHSHRGKFLRALVWEPESSLVTPVSGAVSGSTPRL